MKGRVFEEYVFDKFCVDVCIDGFSRLDDVCERHFSLQYDECSDHVFAHVVAGEDYAHEEFLFLFVLGGQAFKEEACYGV